MTATEPTTTSLTSTGLPAEPTAAPALVPALESALALLPPAPPLTELAAVNPLAGLDHLHWTEAVRLAGTYFGADAHLPMATYAEAWRAGRITREDLRGALEASRSTPDGVRARLSPQLDEIDEIDVVVADALLAEETAAAPDTATGARRSLLTPSEWFDARNGTDVRGEIDRRAGQWVGLALGATAARFRGPVARHGLFAAWAATGARDRSLPRSARQRIELLRGDPAVAIEEARVRLGVPEGAFGQVVVGEATAQPGWAARLVWDAAHDRYPKAPLDALAELVAMRLGLSLALLPAGSAAAGPPEPPSPEGQDRAWAIALHLGVAPTEGALATVRSVLRRVGDDLRPLWQAALETGPRRALLTSLPAPPAGPEPRDRREPEPAAQIVTCIDVRSEALRRRIEQRGPYATVGFAGFFGLPMAWRPLDTHEPMASCPLVVTPAVEVGEQPSSDGARRRVRHRRGRTSGVAAARDRALKGATSPYLCAEALGWVTGPAAAVRTLAPGLLARLSHRPGRIDDLDVDVDLSGVPPALRVDVAEAALRGMGLAGHLAPVVVLVGHGSTTTANPYEAALRCGACGGRDGTENARALASILSDPHVREGLGQRGIHVPDDTIVLAGRHDTTTDTVVLVGPLPDRPDVERLVRDLAAAGTDVAAERATTLPGASAGDAGSARRRARDWAEPTPEWGLAGNMAFVIADRSLTRHLELGRGAFLHSYDRSADEDGSVLAGILAGPALVTQWINAAYHFSVTAPHVFGSGSKAVHNPVGVSGVLSGAGGDLRLGLPVQSVATDGLVHEPVRLMVVIDAPPERVDEALEGAPRTMGLVVNEWIDLVAADEAHGWQRRTRAGWEPALPDTHQGAR